MATVIRKYYPWNSVINPLKADLETMWNWASIDWDSNNYAYFWLDSAKTYGLGLIFGYGESLSLKTNTTSYHGSNNARDGITVQFEKTTNALILSTAPGNVTITGTNCDKYIICNATNPTTNAIEPIIIYIGSKSSSNVSMMLASDVVIPTDNSEQNGNANVSSKYTALINLYNTKSNFVATDVYKSMFMELSAWSFGDVMLNGHRYRMSGSIFALDE